MTHKDDVDMLKHAFKDGADMMRDALSMPRDPDLANYQKLSSQDFMDMTTKFGSEPVIDYIKRMEMKAGGVKEKKNAS